MGRSCRGSTPPARRPASAVAACTAIVRWKALSWAAACFLAAMPGAQQRRRPPEGPGWHLATAWEPICLCRIEPLSCNVFSNRARPFMRPAHAAQAGPIRGSETEMTSRTPGTVEAQVIQIPLTGDPERSMAQRDIQRVVEHAIDEHPDAFRIVFITRVNEGMNVAETSQILRLKPETVKTRLHR